jgi:hypothetical protein
VHNITSYKLRPYGDLLESFALWSFVFGRSAGDLFRAEDFFEVRLHGFGYKFVPQAVGV